MISLSLQELKAYNEILGNVRDQLKTKEMAYPLKIRKALLEISISLLTIDLEIKRYELHDENETKVPE